MNWALLVAVNWARLGSVNWAFVGFAVFGGLVMRRAPNFRVALALWVGLTTIAVLVALRLAG